MSPTFNERDNVDEFLRRVLAAVPSADVFIVDDNSPDGTGKLAEETAADLGRAKVMHRPGKEGLGTAYRDAFRHVLSGDSDVIVTMDADFSHNPEDFVKLYNSCILGGSDVAIGSRYISGVNVVNWPMGRVLMSYFAGYYVRFITGMSIMDVTAGFKCYHSKVLKTITAAS